MWCADAPACRGAKVSYRAVLPAFLNSFRLRIAPLAATLALLMPGAAGAADPGYTWRTVPWGGGGYVDGFVYHPRMRNLLYARTDVGGAYRYDVAARRWIPLLDALGHDEGDLNGILSLAVDPNDPGKLYLACGLYLGQWAHNAAVLRSDDQGQTWKKTDLTIKLGGNADGRGAGERLQVDPNAGDILYLGSNQDGLWKSMDGARSFARVGGFPGKAVSLVLFDPNSGSRGAATRTLYVGSADGTGGLFVSRDGGSSFAPVPGAPSQTPQHAVIGPDGFLYVAFAAGDGKNKSELNPNNVSTGGVWKMDLKTGKWAEITPVRPAAGGPTFGYSGIDVDPIHPGTIVASTIDRWWPEPDDIFLSRDGGAHWTSLRSRSHLDRSRFPWLMRDGMVDDHDQARLGSWTSDVKINPFNPDEMIYGTGGGVWMTRNLSAADTGRNVEFDFADDNLEETATTQLLSPPAGATLLATFGDEAGGSWDDVNKTPTAAGAFRPNESNRSIDVAWLNPAVLARVADNKPYGYHSEDGGATWTPFAATPPYTPQDAQGNWRSMGPLAVSAGGTSILWDVPRDKAYVSFDTGRTWTPAAGWPQDTDGRQTPIADRAINGVFYVHDRSSGQILMSIDGGKSFKPIITGIPKVEGWQGAQLAAAPGQARDLWLAGPFGLFHSAGAGKPLAQLKTVDDAWAIGFGKAAPGQSYPAVFLSGKVKGQAGLWRSDDTGQSWVRINDDAHRFGDGGLLAGDPTEYGTVYVARGAGGIIVGRITQ